MAEKTIDTFMNDPIEYFEPFQCARYRIRHDDPGEMRHVDTMTRVTHRRENVLLHAPNQRDAVDDDADAATPLIVDAFAFELRVNSEQARQHVVLNAPRLPTRVVASAPEQHPLVRRQAKVVEHVVEIGRCEVQGIQRLVFGLGEGLRCNRKEKENGHSMPDQS